MPHRQSNKYQDQPDLHNTSKPLQNQIALMTDVSEPIGSAVAEAYAAAGATLILVASSVDRLEPLDDRLRQGGHSPLLVPLDICQPMFIEHLAKTIAERYGYIDILVGNSGYLPKLTPLTHLPPLEWDKTLQTNLTVNWQLLRWFDPLLRRSPTGGRVIFMTRKQAKSPQAYWGAYGVSKAALEHLAAVYAQENPTIQVQVIDPGKVQMALRLTTMSGEFLEESVPIAPAITDLFVKAACPKDLEIQP